MKVHCQAGIDALMARYSDPTGSELVSHVAPHVTIALPDQATSSYSIAHQAQVLDHDAPRLTFHSLPSPSPPSLTAAAAQLIAVTIVNASSCLIVPSPPQ